CGSCSDPAGCELALPAAVATTSSVAESAAGTDWSCSPTLPSSAGAGEPAANAGIASATDPVPAWTAPGEGLVGADSVVAPSAAPSTDGAATIGGGARVPSGTPVNSGAAVGSGVAVDSGAAV